MLSSYSTPEDRDLLEKVAIAIADAFAHTQTAKDTQTALDEVKKDMREDLHKHNHKAVSEDASKVVEYNKIIAAEEEAAKSGLESAAKLVGPEFADLVMNMQQNAKARDDAINAQGMAVQKLEEVNKLKKELEEALAYQKSPDTIAAIAKKLTQAEKERQFAEFQEKLAKSQMEGNPVGNDWGTLGRCPTISMKTRSFISMLPKSIDIGKVRTRLVAAMNAMGPGVDCSAASAKIEGALLREVVEVVVPPNTIPTVVNRTKAPMFNSSALEAGPCILKGLLTSLYGQRAGKKVAQKLWTVLADSGHYNASVVAEHVFDALAEISTDASVRDALLARYEPPLTPEAKEIKDRQGSLYLLKEVYVNMRHLQGNHSLYSATQVTGTTLDGLLKKNHRVMQKLIQAHKAESVAEMLLARMSFFLKQRAPRGELAAFLQTGTTNWFTSEKCL